MTLEYLEVDLARGFDAGQAYALITFTPLILYESTTIPY